MGCDGDMAGIEIANGSEEPLLPRAHRVVRALDRSEGPFAGALVTSGDGMAVRMDAATLGGWAGWKYSGADHVAAPVDVCRRGGGHDVLLPWCTDRVLGFLVRRTAAGRMLTPGECSTLVVSLLRGLDEVGEGVDGGNGGEWWLTDGGRPVFVLGDGADVRAGAAEIIGRLAADNTDKVVKRALDVIAQGLGKTSAQPRLPRRLLDAWEAELLNVAAAQPLERGGDVPEPARGDARTTDWRASVVPHHSPRLRADRARTDDARHLTARVRAISEAARTLVEAMVVRAAALRGARVGRRSAPDTTSASTGGVGGGVERASRRRRSLIVAGAAAAVVLATGLLWPDGGTPGEAADGAPLPAASAPSGAGEAPAEVQPAETADAESEPAPPERPEKPHPTSEARSGDDVVAAASSLLGTIAGCRVRGDVACAGGVASGSTGVVKALEIAAKGKPALELVDEYGDVAVVRLSLGGDTAEAAARLMVVLIRTDEKWLVRDVYDVADQPQ